MFDVIIRGADVIDGTGRPRRRADVGIEGGRITAVGALNDATAATEIDGTGKVVTPGFVDVHTHYDAQVFWDGALTPSPLHGVTTALAGNCGFSIAPLSGRTADGDYLMRMLARVEGMPLDTLRDAVPWDWTSTAEYLDAIDGTLGINAGFMVGHSAVRRTVMGDAAAQRAATAEEIAAMGDALHQSLEAGGLGFSSSWARTHNDEAGNMVPSRYATEAELLELCRVTGQHVGTSLEFIPMLGKFEPWARDLMAEMSVAAQRPLNWNVMLVTAGNVDECFDKLLAGDVAAERGGKVVALTVPMNFGVRLSFRSGFILDAMPGWESLMGLPVDQKLAMMRDPNGRAHMNELAQGPDNTIPYMAKWGKHTIFDVVAPENQQYRGRTVHDIALDEGRDPWDVLCDIAVADELNTSFGLANKPDRPEDWNARLQVWRDRRAVIGASDAGAHLDLLASFNYTTILLDKAVRENELL
ncbi:MAG: aminoacylase, partial [Acidimicrobiia bacterium]|nr:aminoacylase [Acidimicrobiia bacterium]